MYISHLQSLNKQNAFISKEICTYSNGLTFALLLVRTRTKKYWIEIAIQTVSKIDNYCPRKEFNFYHRTQEHTTSKNNCIVWLSSYFGTQGSLSVCMLLSSISFFQCSLKATCTHMACSLKFNMDIKVDVPRKKLSFCSFEKWLLQITNLKNLAF